MSRQLSLTPSGRLKTYWNVLTTQNQSSWATLRPMQNIPMLRSTIMLNSLNTLSGMKEQGLGTSQEVGLHHWSHPLCQPCSWGEVLSADSAHCSQRGHFFEALRTYENIQ